MEGDWYFYTSRTVQQGKETFRKNWGNRLLEDYWFLSHKSPTMTSALLAGTMAAEEEASAADSAEQDTTALAAATDSSAAAGRSQYGDPADPHSIAYYLKGLPTTQAQRDSMHAQEATCLLNAGYLYYDGIKNTDRAIACYVRMADDFSDDPQIVQTFYQLYRIYSLQGNTPQANYYRRHGAYGLPGQRLRNLIRDENYYKESSSGKRKPRRTTPTCTAPTVADATTRCSPTWTAPCCATAKSPWWAR